MSLRYRFAICIILGIMLPSNVAAGNDFEWKPISASDWAIAADSTRQISDAAVIFENIVSDCQDWQNDDKLFTLYRRVRILSDEGRKWGDVEVPIIDIDQKIKDIKGRTISRDGTIAELTKDMIFDKDIVKVKGKKLNQTKFSLPAVTNDCIVEYMIKLDANIFAWIIQSDIPVLNFDYHWMLPKFTVYSNYEKSLVEQYLTPNYLFFNELGKMNVQQLPSLKRAEELVFSTSDVPPFESEPYSMADASLQTKLICYLGSGNNPQSHWGDVSKALIEVQDDFCKKDRDLRKIIESFGPLETDEAKIAAAYDWISENIRNVSYYDLIDTKSGKELKVKDCKSVNDVLKFGYGGRTDINYVFCDMLREMNINAKIVYARDRTEDLFIVKAKYWQFDNSLAAVKRDDNSYDFYAPGHPMTPLGIVPWYLEGTKVLIGDTDNNLGTIPFSKTEQNTRNYVYTYTVNEDLEVEGEFSARMTGQPARALKVAIINEDSADYDHLLVDEIKKQFGDQKINLVAYKGLDQRDAAAIINCTIEQPDFAMTGDRVLLKPLSFTTDASNPFESKDRKTPILFNYALQLRESVQINFPPGWIIEALPNDTTFDNAAGTCAVVFERFGEGISAQKMFTIKEPFWTPDLYYPVQSLFQAGSDFSNLIVVLKQAGENDGSVLPTATRDGEETE